MSSHILGQADYIACRHVSKSFGTVKVIEDLHLDVAKGEFLSLLGPSGSGKTTLLMMLAGFEHPTSGDIHLDKQKIDRLPAYKRDMGVVFQSYALFPHMSVSKNVAFPLEMRNVPRGEIAQRVERALSMVELSRLGDRRPTELSGGQQQRVALARALVFEPRVVLMDEPLGALDKRLRQQMQLDIRELHQRLGLTIIFVTHDQSEALTMSDRIAVFNKGRIEQIGAPHEIYDRPSTRFVADFIGETNLVAGVVDSPEGDGSRVKLANGQTIVVPAKRNPGETVDISIRPERIILGDESARDNCLPARIKDCVYSGDHTRVELDVGGNPLIVKAQMRDAGFVPGEMTKMAFDKNDCWVLPA